VADVVDAFMAQLAQGEKPEVEDYVHRHPELADLLRKVLPALQVLEPPTAMSEDGSLLLVGALGDFRIVREVGRGGMGIVYEAQQISLGRRVALKILPFAATMDPRQLQRFHNEARAAASLEHPHIVPVYGVGCERGVHYYAMKFIDGQSLAAIISAQRMDIADSPSNQSTAESPPGAPANATTPIAKASTQRATSDPAAFRQIAGWGIQAAEALEHAHAVGIIHRDIKPANLMIDSRGSLWIADFGLARTAADAGLTMTGDVLGTLRYMSPEQALAKHGLVDHHTDIYSLGVTLYELLTGKPAVAGKDREQILNGIALDEPQPPRALDAAIPQDLETIVLKAVEKNPADRYASALALAEDLRRFLDDKPIRARPPSVLQRVKKWSRLHGPAVLAGTILLSLALGLAAVATLMLWLNEKEKDEALGLAQQARQQAKASEASLRHHLYAADIKLAYQEWQKGHLLLTLDRLTRHRPVGDQEDLRGFEWYYLQRLCHAESRTLSAHEGGVNSVAYSHDGSLLATAGEDRSVKIWAVDTGVLRTTIHAHDRRVNWVEFSPTDHLLASAGDDATAKIWDLATGKLRITIRKPGERVVGVLFLPGGKIHAGSLQDALVTLWDIDAPEASVTLRDQGGGIRSLRASPDAKTIATGSSDGTIRLWDRGTGRLKATLTGHLRAVRDVVFSHDNCRLASASEDGTVRLWDVANGMETATFRGHTDSVETVAFSSGDALLASAGRDTSIRVWELTSRKLLNVLRGHTGRIWELQFAPNGKTLASASADGTMKLWDPERSQERKLFSHESDHVRSVTFSPDGRTLATGKDNGNVQLWDLANPQSRGDVAGIRTPVSLIVFAGDGTLAASWGDGSIQLWDPSTTKKLLMLPGDKAMPGATALSADGRTLASGMRDGSVRLWDSVTGRVLADLTGNSASFLALAFAPDGLTLASGAPEGRVWLWDVKKGRVVDELRGLRDLARWLVYSRDGRFLAGGGHNGNIAIWHLATGREPHFASHKRKVNHLVFSPDGKTLASASGDEVILWNVTTGQEMIRLEAPELSDCDSVAFSPDGQILAGAGVRREPEYGGDITFWLAPRDEVTAESGGRRP
jgi:WD40 repeat protein/serine/threonine protein kinase